MIEIEVLEGISKEIILNCYFWSSDITCQNSPINETKMIVKI